MKHYFGWLVLAIIAVVSLGVYYFLKYQKTSGLILYSDTNNQSSFYYPKNYLVSQETVTFFESIKDDSRFSFQYFNSNDSSLYLNNEEQKIIKSGQNVQYGQNNYLTDQATNNFIFQKDDFYYIFRFTPEFVQKSVILSSFKP
ncbi:MAG TPA: hypothetical protein PK370_02130 [Candidatus Woesebacteria bacterium]|nr:hypothetical protein [Candidatus Woesebacteria bacterium]